jgi:hypothetical protein
MNYGPIPKIRARGNNKTSATGWVEGRGKVKRKDKNGTVRSYQQFFYCWQEQGYYQQSYLNAAKRSIAYSAIAAGQSIAEIKSLLEIKK